MDEYIPTIGRLLMMTTFLEDDFRVATEWSNQIEYLAYSSIFSHRPIFLRKAYLIFSVIVQMIAPALIIFNKKIIFACYFLLSYMITIIAIYGFSLPNEIHYQGKWRFVIRCCALTGGLMMLIANKKWKTFTDKKYCYIPGLISIAEPYQWLSWLQFAGRLLLAALCYQFFDPWHGWLYAITCSLFSGLVVVGFKAEFGSLILAVLLTINNIAVNDFWSDEEFTVEVIAYFFFQDLSILGALLLLASLGPGGISLDGKKHR